MSPERSLASWPHNDLESAFERAARDPEARPAFWKQLLASTLIVPKSDDRTDRGDRVAFTSVEVLAASVPAGTGYAHLPATEVLRAVAGSGVFLNPAGPYGKLFTAAELDFAHAGFADRGDGRFEAVRPAQADVGRLEHEPAELLEALTHAFDRLGTVHQASVVGVRFPEGGEQRAHPLIVIDSRSSHEDIRNAISQILSDWATINGLIDVIYTRDGGSFLQSAMRHGVLFYLREHVPSAKPSGVRAALGRFFRGGKT